MTTYTHFTITLINGRSYTTQNTSSLSPHMAATVLSDPNRSLSLDDTATGNIIIIPDRNITSLTLTNQGPA